MEVDGRTFAIRNLSSAIRKSGASGWGSRSECLPDSAYTESPGNASNMREARRAE